jgi:hypothetical protein
MGQKRFHGDENGLDKEIHPSRHRLTRVGVVPPEFRGSTGVLVSGVWMPITMASEMGRGATLS